MITVKISFSLDREVVRNIIAHELAEDELVEDETIKLTGVRIERYLRGHLAMHGDSFMDYGLGIDDDIWLDAQRRASAALTRIFNWAPEKEET